MKVDFDRALKLMNVVKEVATTAPGFVHISSEAMAELRELDQEIRKHKQRQQNQPVTPAPVGDPDSPPQGVPPGGSPQEFSTHPEASKPLEGEPDLFEETPEDASSTDVGDVPSSTDAPTSTRRF
jgi:hypothetical protein